MTTTNNYATWEDQVIDAIEVEADCNRSDAQGIVEINSFHMSQAWAKGLEPKETAVYILSKID